VRFFAKNSEKGMEKSRQVWYNQKKEAVSAAIRDEKKEQAS